MDYTYPSVYLAYLMFVLCALLACWFLARSVRDGYWGEHSEDTKFRMLEDDDGERRSHE